jgi:hypothetical protein
MIFCIDYSDEWEIESVSNRAAMSNAFIDSTRKDDIDGLLL